VVFVVQEFVLLQLAQLAVLEELGFALVVPVPALAVALLAWERQYLIQDCMDFKGFVQGSVLA
jgi:hypothetical protein